MSTTDELKIQQEIRKLVVLRDSFNDKIRSQRYKNNLGYAKRRNEPTNVSKPQIDASKTEEENSSILNLDYNKKGNHEANRNNNFQGPDFEIEKRPKIIQDDETQNRNRRMMRLGIIGHLTSANAQLQKEKDSKMIQLQQSQDQKVELRLEHGKRNLSELRRRDIEEQRHLNLQQAQVINSQIAGMENELTRIHLVKHYQNMKNFIRTQSHPRIFWVPAKFNDKTKALLQESINSIEEKIDSFRNKDFTGTLNFNVFDLLDQNQDLENTNVKRMKIQREQSNDQNSYEKNEESIHHINDTLTMQHRHISTESNSDIKT